MNDYRDYGLINASNYRDYREPPKPKYVIVAPPTPGAKPSWVGSAETLAEAERKAADFSRGRRDLNGHDVRINDANGNCVVRVAGLGS